MVPNVSLCRRGCPPVSMHGSVPLKLTELILPGLLQVQLRQGVSLSAGYLVGRGWRKLEPCCLILAPGTALFRVYGSLFACRAAQPFRYTPAKGYMECTSPGNAAHTIIHNNDYL